MKNKVSKELKRFNYLFGETDAVYHEMYLKSGLADSAGSILYAILENGQILAKKTVGRILKAEDEIFATWSREDVEKYLQLTERYMIALKEKAKEM